MRKLFLPLIAACAVLAAGYVALPFWTALELKRAIRTGDVATVESRVEWTSVRSSLRQSLAEHAPEEAKRRFARVPFFRGFAERMAVKYSGPVVDKMVESYGTPEGLIQMASWRDRLRGTPSAKTLTGVASEMYKRVKKVSFTSLTRLEVVIADRVDPNRHMLSALELRETGWKLTEVRILKAAQTVQ